VTAVSNRYLEGNYAPVADEITVTDLPVTGQVPAELSGRYARIGPNPIAADPASYHWFLGEGMVHGVRLDGGQARWYRNRYVRNGGVNEHLGRPATPGPTRDNDSSPNTNVIAHAGRTLAIVEAGGLPMELDDEFETVQRTDFGATLPDGFTAHPKLDPATGELHAMTYHWTNPGVRYLVVGSDGTVRKQVDIDLGASVMVHDMALTASSALVFDLPCVFDLEAAMSGRGFPYLWKRDRAARVGVLPRDGEAADIRWVEVDPCYVFHPMNAYDQPDGTIVVDVPRWPSVFDTVQNGPDEGALRFERWTLDPDAGVAKSEVVDDLGIEFPRIDERRLGAAHRYGYGVSTGPSVLFGSVVRYDLATGERTARADNDRYAWGEVVFVPRHDGAEEADGWVMGYRYDNTTDTSDLVILDATDVAGTPVAEVHLPRRVPFGFHGNWLPDAG